ncbi:hypothetical protein V2G26_007733 [Clonostachys chloroleuca]
MTDMSSPATPDRSGGEPPRKGKKRSYIACKNAKKDSLCEYPQRERRVTVSQSYLDQLQNSNRRTSNVEAEPESREASPSRPSMAQDSRATSQGPVVDSEISNPYLEPRSLFQLDQALRQQFVGESTCLAFGDRILQCLNPHSTPPSMTSEHQYVRDPAFARQTSGLAGCKLPERIRGMLLIRVALRFIGQDYHFFMHGDFLQQLEKAYASKESPNFDAVWACKLFVVLALGELYSTSIPTASHGRGPAVPGTDYFLTAVKLLQDLFEEPSIAQVEVMLLFCFYSNALGRVKSAHMYSGIAMRMSTTLGLHRCLPEGTVLSPVERENRIRLWWTVYIFDRSTSSRLGQPVTIQDSDIDVQLPSFDGLPKEVQERLGSPAHLAAHIELSRITGSIMQDIYGPSSRSNPGKFVQNVRSILKKLKKWDAHAPPSLQLGQGTIPRSVASLQLHFNQCIILTTRPILLHVLKVKKPFANPPGAATAPISDTARTLSDACISAARTSNSIIYQLFIENALATYGYFDTHHLFSSTLVLIISAIISPNSSDSDAVQAAFQLLKGMRDSGNATAAQYFSRLVHMQWNVSRLFARATAVEEAAASNNALAYTTPMNYISPNPPQSGISDFEAYDWNNFLPPNSADGNYEDGGIGHTVVDPLDNPLLQAFLDTTDASWDENLGLTTEELGSYVV